jgi:UDP-N-acetylmuramoyl-tripeptide--D-alanyl-D-alanine ligase
MVGNALLAAAVGGECGLTLEEIAGGISRVELPGARMQVVTRRGASIINDAYNANPASMKAALVALREFPGAARRAAVLGSMGELGQQAGRLHHEVGAFAASQGVEFLIAVGPHAGAYLAGAREAGFTSGVSALDASEAATALRDFLREGDVVLIKGSHFMGLERVVELLAGEVGA